MAVPPRRRGHGHHRSGARGSQHPGHRDEGVAHRGDPGRVEPIVDPDATGLRRPDAALAAIPRDGDERRHVTDPPEQLGVGVGALPGQRQRDQPGVTGRRLDRVAVATGRTRTELERPGGLHRPEPHVDRVVEEAGDDGHGVKPEMPTDRGMLQTRRE